jgi:hypothetical protein
MRTTVNIDDPILKELRRLQKKGKKSLGRLMSDLLAQALRDNRGQRKMFEPPAWVARPMGPRIDLTDKEALYALLDRPSPREKNKKRP